MSNRLRGSFNSGCCFEGAQTAVLIAGSSNQNDGALTRADALAELCARWFAVPSINASLTLRSR